MKTLKLLFRRLLRYLCITKPIDLSDSDIFWIKLCKLHYTNKYPLKGTWVNTLKIPFEERYGWVPDECYNDFLDCIFNRLLDLHLKIQFDQSGSHVQLKNIMSASFIKSYKWELELPIERTIVALCAQIQNNAVIENGINRYYLYIEEKDITDDCFATHV